MEDGKVSEKWYISCVDLIKSRFHPEDLMKDVIADINIRRVIRIHNRFLKNKFEEKMEVILFSTYDLGLKMLLKPCYMIMQW